MKKLILALALLLSACASATPIPTAIPLSEIDLSPYLFQAGDLPSSYAAGQIRDFAPGMFDDLPKADNVVFLQLEVDGDEKGGVAFFLFENENDRESAYQKILEGMTKDAEATDKVGEKASVLDFSLGGTIELVFQRCTGVIHVRLFGTGDTNTAIAYARRLDERIQSVICR